MADVVSFFPAGRKRLRTGAAPQVRLAPCRFGGARVTVHGAKLCQAMPTHVHADMGMMTCGAVQAGQAAPSTSGRPFVVDLSNEADSDPDEVSGLLDMCNDACGSAVKHAPMGPVLVHRATFKTIATLMQVLIVGEKRGTRPAAQHQGAGTSTAHQRRATAPPHQAAHQTSNRQHQAGQGLALPGPSWQQPAVPAAPPSPERGIKCPVCLEKSDDMSSTACG